MNLRSQVIKTNGAVTYKLEGILDEVAELPAFDPNYSGRLIIDLEKLTMINSLGCRKWIHWIKTCPTGTKISLVKCSSVIVNQMNILVSFVPPGVEIISIYVPYYCDSCQLEDQVLVTIKAPDSLPFDLATVSETKSCPSCKAPMEIDGSKKRYFGFLTKKTA